MQSIFGTDGIRGRFNKEITYSLAYKVGYALGLIFENKNPIGVMINAITNEDDYLLDISSEIEKVLEK